MSWEVQGRQFHGWFGTGTGDGPDPAGAVLQRASGLVSGGRGAEFRVYLGEGGAEALREALPIWAAASALDGGAFRRLVTGPALGEGAAAAVHDVGRAFAAGDVDGAGTALATVVESERAERLRYGLAYARDQAVYSSVNGLLPVVSERLGRSGAAEQQGGNSNKLAQPISHRVTPVPGIPVPPVFLRGSRENEGFVKDLQRLLGWLRHDPSSVVAAGDSGPGASGDGRAGVPLVSPMEPPNDAKDPKGAKAPGKPGDADGFEDPKGGEQWVKSPDGRGYGWLDKSGDVWVPTGWAGAPGTGTVGPAHGGPHWDVQSPNGNYRNVRPSR